MDPDIETIKNSPLFDANWYVTRYPDVAIAGIDPARHYLIFGGRLGRDPGPSFSSRAYLDAHPELEDQNLNPLLHHERNGQNRAPNHRLTAPQQGVASAIDTLHQHLGFGRIASESRRLAAPLHDYAILTPTGDRAAAFNRCLQMVSTQTVRPREWIIVDDGEIPLTDQMDIPRWATYIRRIRQPDDPPHTLSTNVLAGLDHVTQTKVVIVEDDDWYAPDYAEFMLPYLDSAEMVGLNNIRYYHLAESMWKTGTHPRHTAFAQTAFKRGPAWASLVEICRSNITDIREKGHLDLHWWRGFDGPKHLIQTHPCLHTGLKGGFGRPGLADGHQRTDPGYTPDPDGSYLGGCIGADRLFYDRWRTPYRNPCVIYTDLTTANHPPPHLQTRHDGFDLLAFSDKPLSHVAPWVVLPTDQRPDNTTLPRSKALPHLYFPEYDWSLWINPNHTLKHDPWAMVTAAINARTSIVLPKSTQESDPTAFMLRRHGGVGVFRAMTRWWTSKDAQTRPAETLVQALAAEGITPLWV